MTTLTSPAQLRWLAGQVAEWRDAGLVADDQAAAILSGYRAGHRFSLTRLLLTLGACFVGVGVIWLVAANLDALAPGARFVAVTAFWLALLGGGETLAARREPLPSPVPGALRLLAALAFGAVLFQAAQSLQVPAYDAHLVGLWALGTLAHAYARGAVAPLLVGVVTGSVWLVWASLAEAGSVAAVVLALASAGAVALGAGALHSRWSPAFAPAWRAAGTLLGLVALFVAALPDVGDGAHPGTGAALAVLGGVAVAAAGLVLGRGDARGEPLLGLAVLAACGLLVAFGRESIGNAAVGVALYVGAALAVAVLGTVRSEGWLTAFAAGGLVVFTTFQSFSVFAEIIEGAWLFVALGTVFVATGWLVDRTRRELARTLAESGPVAGGAR